MKTLRVMFAIAAFAALMATAASAHDSTPRVDQREYRQGERIQQGRRSGELTRPENRRLMAGQRHVQRMERRAKADGCVTQRERARMGHAQDRQSQRIWRLKHNNRDRNQGRG